MLVLVLTLSAKTGRYDDMLYRKRIMVYRINKEDLVDT
jgi:hypothetical protein